MNRQETMDGNYMILKNENLFTFHNSPFTFSDYETGLTYMLARYYSQGYGRFLSPDPGYDYDQLDPMSWNLYAYVRGNPIKSLDPTGEETFGIGINFSGGCMAGGGVSLLFVMDDKGGKGFSVSFSKGGIGILAFSINIAMQFTNASEISKLNGQTVDIGGSAGEGPSVGFELITAKKPAYIGMNVYLGFSPKLPLPFELHGFVEDTKIHSVGDKKDKKTEKNEFSNENHDKKGIPEKKSQGNSGQTLEQIQKPLKVPSYNKFLNLNKSQNLKKEENKDVF